jgi:GTPase SAR1 family protein
MCDRSPEAKQNALLNQTLDKLNKEDKKEIKLLLLGAGGCGKST